MNKFDKQHLIYERQFFQRLIKEFRKIGKDIPIDNLTFDNAENILKIIISEDRVKQILFDMHLSIGNDYGKKVGRQLNRAFNERKKFTLPLFSQAFMKYLISYYSNSGGADIVLLIETYISEVVKQIKVATELNETVIQMRDRIFTTVNKPNFYKWQALRIARTETTFAMNSAKQVTGEVSGFLLEKVWSAKRDGRERPAHGEVDKVAVEQNALFTVGGELMGFPGDKSNGASAGNLINCRCSFGYRGKRGEDGQLIYVDI